MNLCTTAKASHTCLLYYWLHLVVVTLTLLLFQIQNPNIGLSSAIREVSQMACGAHDPGPPPLLETAQEFEVLLFVELLFQQRDRGPAGVSFTLNS